MYTPTTNLQDLIESQIAAKNAQLKQEQYVRQHQSHPLSERSQSSKFQAILKNEENAKHIAGLAPTVTQIAAPPQPYENQGKPAS